MRDRVSAVGWIRSVYVALGLAGVVSTTAQEQVIFSDPKSKASPPAESQSKVKRSQGWENPFSNLKPGNSLQGITAPPFAPPSSLAPSRSPLTPRERELLMERRDWILRSPGSGADTELDVNRAFGVREHSVEGNTSESTAPKGDLLRYYERLESSDTPGAPQPGTDPLRNPAGPLGLGSAPGRDGYRPPGERSLEPRVSAPAFLAGPNPGAREPGQEANSGIRAWVDNPFQRDRPSGREASSPDRRTVRAQFLDSPHSPGVAPGPSPETELTGVARLLGANPIVSPVSELSITSLDPVTAYPDPTREALNPVVVSPGRNLSGPLVPQDLLAAESLERRPNLAPSAAARGPLENPFQSMSGAIGGSESTVGGKRKLHSIKAQLELPGRSF
ncbi:MAG: hypothetical protein M5U12_11695 [Verrucomicrobia bacterium]|nr:hypothetical protein [Verrucomicrobiota bacterium]